MVLAGMLYGQKGGRKVLVKLKIDWLFEHYCNK